MWCDGHHHHHHHCVLCLAVFSSVIFYITCCSPEYSFAKSILLVTQKNTNAAAANTRTSSLDCACNSGNWAADCWFFHSIIFVLPPMRENFFSPELMSMIVWRWESLVGCLLPASSLYSFVSRHTIALVGPTVHIVRSVWCRRIFAASFSVYRRVNDVHDIVNCEYRSETTYIYMYNIACCLCVFCVHCVHNSQCKKNTIITLCVSMCSMSLLQLGAITIWFRLAYD